MSNRYFFIKNVFDLTHWNVSPGDIGLVYYYYNQVCTEHTYTAIPRIQICGLTTNY